MSSAFQEKGIQGDWLLRSNLARFTKWINRQYEKNYVFIYSM